MNYRIRKTGRTWKVWHRYAPNGGWHGPIAESTHWQTVVWCVTGYEPYRPHGLYRFPCPCQLST